jgi:predicted phage terminase large subunit-like protein
MRKPACPAPLKWARRFLPEYFTDDPCQFHVELFEALQDSNRRCVACVAPRGHAKSTCASLAFPLWCICEGRRRNIVIVTHEGSLATQFVSDIRTELETNEHILDTYGDLCAPNRTDDADKLSKSKHKRRMTWQRDRFTTNTGITVQAKGSGAGFRGMRVGPNRPDLIICDDLEKDELVQSAEMRRKLEQWLRKVVMPALAPDGRLIVLGSLIHYDSLLANLRDRRRFPRWDYRVYRALEGELRPDGTYRMVALWPARWPVRRLYEERERIGTYAFEGEYQANPIDDTIRVFRPEWLQRYEEHELAGRRLVNLVAVDPAVGKTAGDYFAVWVGSVATDDGTIYTRRLTLERIGIVEQRKRIIAAYEMWRPVKIGIETNVYQEALRQMLEEDSRRLGLYMPLVPLQTRQNKELRIAGTAAFYENGTFRLPPALDPEAERQFLHFPKGGHDDAPDVCAMGIELARSLRTGGFDGRTSGTGRFSRRGGW